MISPSRRIAAVAQWVSLMPRTITSRRSYQQTVAPPAGGHSARIGSGLPRRLRKERPDQRAQVAAAAFGTGRIALLALLHRQAQRHFLLAPVTEELVERHGSPPLEISIRSATPHDALSVPPNGTAFEASRGSCA